LTNLAVNNGSRCGDLKAFSVIQTAKYNPQHERFNHAPELSNPGYTGENPKTKQYNLIEENISSTKM
jgi:hypothetical protein